MKLYTREGGRFVEAMPAPISGDLSVAVRSFDAKKQLAHVEVTEHNMPTIQIWRFNGKEWSDSIDAGIFVHVQ
jgi:expansin (peptidoglycan-binding protein)